MKSYSNIQKYFWSLANYDCFLIKFCPTEFNRVAGIGVYFLLQLIIVFFSTVICYNNWIHSFPFIDLIFGGIITWIFFKWIKFSTRLQHEYQKPTLLFGLFILHFISGIILTLPICISLFESEIAFQLFLKMGKLEYGFLKQIWLQPYGLFISCQNVNEGLVIIFFCIAIFLFILFLFFVPYLLIYQSRKSIYNSFKIK